MNTNSLFSRGERGGAEEQPTSFSRRHGDSPRHGEAAKSENQQPIARGETAEQKWFSHPGREWVDSSRGLARAVFWPTPGKDHLRSRTPTGVRGILAHGLFRHPCRGAYHTDFHRGYRAKHPPGTPGYFPSALRAETTQTTPFSLPCSFHGSITSQVKSKKSNIST